MVYLNICMSMNYNKENHNQNSECGNWILTWEEGDGLLAVDGGLRGD